MASPTVAQVKFTNIIDRADRGPGLGLGLISDALGGVPDHSDRVVFQML